MTVDSLNFILADTEATTHLGILLGQFLNTGIVLLLEGNLGTGKTTLVQGIGRGLGITEPIVSPTFTLINEYTEGRLPLYHLDLYRLEAEEVTALHPEIYWEGIDVDLGIMAIEWAERLPYLPPTYISICLRHHNTCGRQVDLSAVGVQLDFLENLTK
ncbi:tRNA (adenosine(37)-N6)-threonylcarbamoyltransferase complex ATPase subunit type 1 TsaE [Gloeocapsopsis dulcis]|uniref:tRNA threonylcarbamoyladenosine biosynthesis protein TsaE n=1 Tax=Gloeocapsopsis dulcis AAB1 = 1H9 TaxID=1433147 RepID=A0A6N8FR70_9CHRO|nr:tRNA (adenosine(37)-N6)-threonylcarbamoyltransferase complex ATPase subunit type 1 TsaE [Gloeocapsopsis dulcis]MUL35491.1 tRNA (adenosine(37)-N6)-threonylcarbamoyltransferase complex ATPase subunit type 1 TsaE [Gloeocapsopsis dulcis AAB1 = 1H9]WNN87608.1 tRNA (adenosine(37)-N6)-threonylcarbamoyltransferase complex ATPase subunit type 1 TsaE [Gloeocapsopsis dulcis]